MKETYLIIGCILLVLFCVALAQYNEPQKEPIVAVKKNMDERKSWV